MTAATGDPSPWPAADIRISTLPYELLARVIFHARARVIIARCASGEFECAINLRLLLESAISVRIPLAPSEETLGRISIVQPLPGGRPQSTAGLF